MENSEPDYIDSILELNNPLSKILDNLLNDYSKDVSDIYLTLYNLKEATTKWNDVSLTSLITVLDEQAVKISELKEEYVNRRKTLASNIRLFTSKYIENDSNDIIHYNNMKLEAKQIIDLFKSSFDYLATSAKFSESSFLALYKLLRELQDPCILFEECTNIITKSQNSLKYAQEQIVQGVSYLESLDNNNSNNESNFSHKEFLELKEKNIELQSYIDDLEQKLQSEKHRNDIEIRSKEQKIRNDIEEQLIEQQNQYELSLSRKEMEINSLLSTINDYNQQSIEANEKGKTLETELVRRRDLEERVRITMTELANANQTISDALKKNESLQIHLTTLETELEKNKNSNKKLLESMNEGKLKATAKLQEMERELLMRPPLDLSNLAEKIGIELHNDNNSNGYIEWKTIENYLVEKIRKVCSEAAESRVREQEILKNFKFKEEECEILKVKSSNDRDTINTMERDLIEAHKTIESQKTILKYQTKGSDDQCKDESKVPSSPKNKSIGQSSKGRIFSPGKLKGSVDNNDIEAGSLLTASALNDATTNDPSDRILIAVQNQRDRYMKASMEKETELNNCKANLERIEEEQHRLRDENLELYRRLRILRATSRKGQDNDDENVRVRIRKDGRSNSIDENGSSSSSDLLEKKYMKAYEEHIDPWRVEELDRQQILSRLNIFEKSLAYVIRFILQDQWARHAFILYLLLVHIFALGYVWQVLNPQLIEEVDQSMKERLAAATYDIAFAHADVE